jgi:chromosome segregation ATPase
LKSALAAQGFTGGSRQETEWSKWVLAEKKELAQVMERHGIEWEKLGTRDEHLSVLNYKKEQRAKEVAALENKIDSQKTELTGLAQQKQELRSEIKSVSEKHDEIKTRLAKVERQESLAMMNVRRYDEEPEWQLPEPSALMTAKTYKTKVVEPLITKLKNAIRSIVIQNLKLKSSVNDLQKALYRSQERVESLTDRLIEAKDANKQLRETARDLGRVKKILGEDKVKHILNQAKTQERGNIKKRPIRIRDVRER